VKREREKKERQIQPLISAPNKGRGARWVRRELVRRSKIKIHHLSHCGHLQDLATWPPLPSSKRNQITENLNEAVKRATPCQDSMATRVVGGPQSPPRGMTVDRIGQSSNYHRNRNRTQQNLRRFPLPQIQSPTATVHARA
jgi:hypothetical protein